MPADAHSRPSDPGIEPHVVIVGGGFGGLAATRCLADLPVRVTLIDRRNHHLFQPLLYQVATAGLNPADIAAPIRSLVADEANVTVLLGEVIGIDEQTVVLDDATSIDFDYLVLAAGTTHSYFGHDEWEAHAPGLKTVEDAIEIRRRILTAFERAERTTDAAAREAELTFVVVGGGPTGVELAGAIAEIAFRTLTREFRAIDPATARIILLEGTDRVLRTYPVELSESARRQLVGLGVDVRLNVTVTGVDADGVDTTDGRIPTHAVVWGAGNQASPLGRLLGTPLDPAGRVVVEADLSVPGRRNVFVIGDMAAVTSDGSPVPGVAQGAIQGGKHMARCIRADLDNATRPAFRYRNKGELATIGRSSAVGVIAGRQLTGWVAWMAWWSVHILFLIDFRSRLLVFLNWAWNYLTFRRGARLITGAWTARNAHPE